MSATPLAFLRGASPLFYELLEAYPDLASGPGGRGWITGDLHLENFGAFRPNGSGTKAKATKATMALFDLNDFDDAIVGPWRFDLLRLTTSLILAGRELGADGLVTLSLCDALLGAWHKSVFQGGKLPLAPPPVLRLIEQVEHRTRLQMLDGRTTVAYGGRHFKRGERYATLPRAFANAVPDALARYVASLPKSARPNESALEIKDMAFRIAGTGSLGSLRIAVLVAGKGGRDGGWIFDMKQEEDPAGAAFASGEMDSFGAERVAKAYNACIMHTPLMLGTTTIRHKKKDISMIVRRLTPQEDKLNLRRLDRQDLPRLAAYLGAVVGRAHARGATKAPHSSWSKSDLEHVRHSAVTLAGLHEAIYLALCERTSDMLKGKGKLKSLGKP